VPTTTQYYTTDGIKKGVPFCNASGFSLPAMDALVDRIKVETDPRGARRWSSTSRSCAGRGADPAAGRARDDRRSRARACRIIRNDPNTTAREHGT
jgi:hypothetical protein